MDKVHLALTPFGAAGPKGCAGEAHLAPYSHRLNSHVFTTASG